LSVTPVIRMLQTVKSTISISVWSDSSTTPVVQPASRTQHTELAQAQLVHIQPGFTISALKRPTQRLVV